MRWRLYERRGSPFTCCFCCHVRTGTLLLGAFSLAWKLLSVMMTLAVIAHHKFDRNRTDVIIHKQDTNIFRTEGYATTGGAAVNTSSWASVNGLGDHLVIELMINMGAALFTVGLLYGVIRGRAKFLLPYFCLQVFYFCLSSLVIIGFFTYEPNIKLWLASQNWLPLKDHLMTMNDGWLVLLAGCAAIICLWIKAYCISIVWSCYRYLIQLGATLPVHGTAYVIETDHCVNCDVPEGGVGEFRRQHVDDATGADNEILLPPKYEDVLQMPPSAEVCNGSTSSLPPAYSEVVDDGAARNN